MFEINYCHETVKWHIEDIKARIVAESGNPHDRFHLGKIILQSMKDNLETEAQIEGSTGQSETYASLLKRSVQCAIGLRKLGLKKGDVIILMAPHHQDLAVPFYAALFLGIIVAPIDMFLGVKELQHVLIINKPKLIFAQSYKVEDITKALKEVDLGTKIVTFDSSNDSVVIEFSELLKNGVDEDITKFRAADFDPAETIAVLIPTSGTTGLPKSTAATHKNVVIMCPMAWLRTTQIPPIKRALLVSPLQWLTAIVLYTISPILKITRIQSKEAMSLEHVYMLINNYRPNFLIISPTMMKGLMNPNTRGNCDFTSFSVIYIGGSAMYDGLIEDMLEVSPKTKVVNVYGMSEVNNVAFMHQFGSPPQSLGKPVPFLEYRLVNIETGKDIEEPNISGELWLKGPGIFKGYYNNPEATEETFEGPWFKTGDSFYRDEHWNFYFVERIKLLLKYMNHQISPVELEGVIRQLPGVLDVAVTGVADADCGDLPVACVVPAPGHQLTAQEVKDHVKASLTETKQLRGGVVFLKELPLTASSKVNRKKLKEMVLILNRE